MKTFSPLNLRVILLSILMASLSLSASAQFEQKFTLQTSAGYVSTLGPDWFSETFPAGISLDAGMQYNFNRQFSMAALLKYSTFFVVEEISGSEYEGTESASFEHYGLTLCPKFRFLPSKRLNPYILGGLSINYMNFYEEYEGGEVEYWEAPISIGFTAGLGLDYRLTDNLSLFVQTGAYWFVLKEEGWEDELLNTLSFQVGLNISLFKSKSL